ncbi:pyridoxamine 5'-phosphate oxidase family protein [Mucilaginibacter aquariorum]|uniref:Pyridoxamine 5'-phosphate oxidase family protein n=1 Tax=Mucilaginibacter aquariorum TaxID=2967225 RepID=A0ABT1SXU3_9SPHI|nr:pyridoxamine 5'-phosphate oxidase family protein [Mucilaginibacter aquariorum]MCQ6957043.1 pyridoxamine 5'-phosphate oxidase family protein [Mucilaginibacter aquariorum]
MNYSEIAFSDAAKDLQEKYGSRNAYEQREKLHVVDGFTENETLFISDQDHFYMASTGLNGYPYIQHRGGPKGFIKVLDNHRIAFIDFSGNKQYISAGNIETNPKVALIMISYPHKARLKLYANARIIQQSEDPILFAQVDFSGYKHRTERMIVLDIEAYDWNCPQHITPRYTAEEIELAFASQRQYIADLEQNNKQLKAELLNLKEN